MKVALITDTHHGVRNDAAPFMDMTKRFMDDVFFPTIEKEGIKQVVHLGDILDRRKFVAFNTGHRLYTDFIGPLMCMVDRFDLILGNHDVVHKNTNSVSGPLELYRHAVGDNFRIYQETQEVELLDGTKVLFVPWINDENREHSLRTIRDTKAQICFGHLELDGFEMYRGQVMNEGMDPSIFSKFDVTCSGHFHHRSSKNGIHYLGSHGEFTWADYNDERGFHIFDTRTRELEFIPNPYTTFEKLHYEDNIAFNRDADLSGKYVKVIVSKREDQILFEQFISQVEACNPIDVQVVDDHLNVGDLVDSLDEVDETEDTLTIFKKAIEASDPKLNRDLMDSFITQLYNEALEIE